ncbi:hypothetical protein [uncultured Bacteroides sp.]|uniref:hypothetical protein n=1 Tax=uncultured Bacteroides sp. TaxID=162156 RepID=UPI002AA5F712|nr:hypothetical protein [uncultured Bacteroides sp.]
MNWQNWVVIILVILCFGEVSRRIYLFFRRAEDNDNPCANCASGCELKDMMEKKQKKCKDKATKSKKNCCG